ncbi:60 kDa inner membrane protein [Brachyspira pilosicoli]|uniref:hypothetical protein n=1 Tax=Brachyspira pilosicoli TaxID=52584 RepID=UPI000E16A79B|nr:hypothetical protein [Brachyspira pilosicoli]SUW08533.1 60 kDa inner membrane protein [Brachyspira pilosicoli]
MKNKNLFFKIYIAFVVIFAVSIIVLSFLGNKERIGYLSEFKINITETLELNNLNIEEINQLFTVNNNLDEAAITNYVLTNNSIMNYSYNFRIKYYDKVFRNSDIYGVYLDTNKVIEDNNFIKNISIGGGSPFGNLTSNKIIDFENIDNINYILKLKNNLIFIFIVLLIILFIYIKNTIYKLLSRINITLIKNKKTISEISTIIIAIVIISIVLLSFFGKKDRIGYLSEFKINVNKTLETNGLNIEETKQLFTINDKLDKIAINNYIFTNTSITNYSYDFRIEYYNKIFKDNIIYSVYPNLDNLPDYIISSTMNDRFGTPFGSLISIKELKYNDKIDIKYYLMINFDVFYYMAIIFIVFLLSVGFYLLKEYWKYKKTLDERDYLFVKKIELIGILLFCFQYWLFYPGNFNFADLYGSIFNALFNVSNNANPFIVDFSIKFLDKLGFTMMPLFFINMFLWYCGLSIIIIGLYLKFKNKYIILLFFISYLYIIFFNNANYLKDFVATLYLFFSCSITLFIILVYINNKITKLLLKCLSLLFLILAMLHRHNFIVTVYPILIWFTYDYLKTKNIKTIKKYLFYFSSIMFINAFILISIYFIFPKIFIKYIDNTSSYHIYLLQIAGCIVPENDNSLIPDYLYYNNKGFSDFANIYNQNNTFADPLRDVVKYSKEIKIIWVKSILKYPLNYIKHSINFTKELCIQKYNAFNSKYIQEYPYGYKIERFFNRVEISNTGDEFYNTKWYKENSGIKFTKLRENIYNFLLKILPNLNIFVFVVITILLFILSFLLILFKKNLINDILVFHFSISFSGISTIIITSLFLPAAVVNQSYRYIYPIVDISVLSLILFITFIYDIGGLKKFIKELKSKDK